MIRVLVVDDSAVAREILKQIIDAADGLMCAGAVDNGASAIGAVAELRPDIVTMDIMMPGMDGFEAARRIMETNPTPIVVVSTVTNVKEAATTFRAVEAGALAAVKRPLGIGHPDFEETVNELIHTLTLMADVTVIRRWSRGRAASSIPPLPEQSKRKIEFAAIGASTGGPPVIKEILSRLKPLPFPTAIVQHMSPGFTEGFVSWLNNYSQMPVLMAMDNVPAHPGRVYVAPDGVHLKVSRGSRLTLSDGSPDHGLRPAVSRLFGSLVDTFGPNAAGIILTGMGRDGAAELKQMRDKGALTIAQDQQTSVIYGMPGAAVEMQGAELVLPPDAIAEILAHAAA